MYKRKNLGNKSQELINLKFGGKRFFSESIVKINSLYANRDNLKLP